MDLIAFLNARLDEDEAAAESATYERPVWRSDMNGVHQQDGLKIAEPHSWYLAEHIALHDPARALREVEAKRKILTMARVYREMTEELLRGNPSPTDPDMIAAASHGATIGLTLVALAEVYSGHPDYRTEWRPQ